MEYVSCTLTTNYQIECEETIMSLLMLSMDEDR